MAVASLVIGILGLIISLCSIMWCGLIGGIFGIVGIILGALARKNNPEKSGVATAGLVLSIIALVLGALLFFMCGLPQIQAVNAIEDAMSGVSADDWNALLEQMQ